MSNSKRKIKFALDKQRPPFTEIKLARLYTNTKSNTQDIPPQSNHNHNQNQHRQTTENQHQRSENSWEERKYAKKQNSTEKSGECLRVKLWQLIR